MNRRSFFESFLTGCAGLVPVPLVLQGQEKATPVKQTTVDVVTGLRHVIDANGFVRLQLEKKTIQVAG
jgi:hypothetical protein